jgi:hypothetical protein
MASKRNDTQLALPRDDFYAEHNMSDYNTSTTPISGEVNKPLFLLDFEYQVGLKTKEEKTYNAFLLTLCYPNGNVIYSHVNSAAFLVWLRDISAAIRNGKDILPLRCIFTVGKNGAIIPTYPEHEYTQEVLETYARVSERRQSRLLLEISEPIERPMLGQAEIQEVLFD